MSDSGRRTSCFIWFVAESGRSDALEIQGYFKAFDQGVFS